MKTRRTFLKIACKPIVLAAFGITVIEACSSEETPDNYLSGSQNENDNKAPLEIDLSDAKFSDLKDIGGWMNYTSENLLLVRISDSEIRAFNNSCPHQGTRDKWSFDGSDFECGQHGNTYSNSCGGSLRCYITKLDGTILTINF
jgi:nitrite reductase/ring-hydroxylating ferredoxin subunit